MFIFQNFFFKNAKSINFRRVLSKKSAEFSRHEQRQRQGQPRRRLSRPSGLRRRWFGRTKVEASLDSSQFGVANVDRQNINLKNLKWKNVIDENVDSNIGYGRMSDIFDHWRRFGMSSGKTFIILIFQKCFKI